MFGAGGGTSSYREAEETDVVLLWGSNARETHPIFFHHLLKGVRRGARLIADRPAPDELRRVGRPVARPRRWLRHRPGERDGAGDHPRGPRAPGVHRRATFGFDEYREAVEPYTLDYAERETGVPAAAIREAALAYARADKAMICWTLGITEHHNAVDNVLSLINLALLTGHVGRYGSGINPLRGQNNVQGGGDMGALPDRLPGFQHVENDALRAKFDAAWGVPVPPQRGWHLSGMFDAMERGELTALYVIGENPMQSEADRHRTERLLRGLDFIVVQDIFLTATAEIADVVLPAAAAWSETEGTVTNSERRVQRVRRAVTPPGEARDDLAIIYAIAKRLGHDWGEASAERTWNELRTLSPVHAGMSYARLDGRGRPPVAVLRRAAPGRAVPPLAAVGGPGAGQPRPVRGGGARPAGRQAGRRLPDPPHHRTAPRLVQHGRAVGRVSLPAPARRDAGPGAGGRRADGPAARASGCGSSPGEASSRRRSGSIPGCARASPS